MKRGDGKDLGGKRYNSHHRGVSIRGSESGMALVMALIVAAIALAFSGALLVMVTSGAQMTGGQRRFQSSLEAGKAGTEVARDLVDARGTPNVAGALTNFLVPAQNVGGFDCLTEKLTKPSRLSDGTPNWNASCQSSLTIDPVSDPASYDMTFNIGVNPAYTIYAKIVDTVTGNSGGTNTLLPNTGTTVSHSGEIITQSIPYLYTIEVLAQDTGNTAEQSRISMLYEY
jgi:hypothetical protein